MDDNEISPYITMTKVRSGEKLQIEQKYVKIREGQNKLMAVSYQAPIYEMVELERFFEDFAPSEKIKFNIGGTGSIGVNFRGIIEGGQKNFSKNIDHKIILLEEYNCPKKDEYAIPKRSSKFVPKVAQKSK
ncbi:MULTISPECIES: hypothetical protein [Methanobrevibacter]|jgi:hypothetical protein|uniref:hypothetical protein n=1 Tax=Methanobrevibacter TaxID=2172 RepID=UPI000377B4EB|nr:hypothetical protein [Methanobrevibacter smithii]